MKILAIGDAFIPAEFMEEGFAGLRKDGFDVLVRQWTHENIEALQRDNLLIEQHGPAAIELPAGLFEDIAEYELVIVQFAPITRQILERAERLRLIGVLRGGTENIDIEAATQRGIAVANTPGRNARAVAEFTVGLIFAEIRNIARSHAALKKAIWRKEFPNSTEIPELFGKTAGLIGLGSVGHLVAGFLAAFGCRIIAYDPYVKLARPGINLLPLAEVLQQADIVSMHARYTEETHHLISAREINLMKPTAILVNTARSGLVDQEALAEALQQKTIRGAALDVFDVEPLPEKHAFLSLDNLTITPHLAGSTRDAFLNSPKMFSSMLQRAMSDSGNMSVVNGIKFPFAQ